MRVGGNIALDDNASVFDFLDELLVVDVKVVVERFEADFGEARCGPYLDIGELLRVLLHSGSPTSEQNWSNAINLKFGMILICFTKPGPAKKKAI